MSVAWCERNIWFWKDRDFFKKNAHILCFFTFIWSGLDNNLWMPEGHRDF